MKLILTEPKNISKSTNPALMFPKWGFEELFSAWLYYNDIWIGNAHKDFTLEYNYIYHFYDLSLFEILGNGGEGRTKHFDQVVDFFKKEGYEVKYQYTWRWENHVEIKGRRIWIYIKGEE